MTSVSRGPMDGGQVWAWGWQAHGQCGHGEEAEIGQHDQKPYMSPKHVSFFFNKKLKGITAGYLHTAVLTQEGEVWTVGSGRFGVLGHGNKDLHHIPKPIDPHQVPSEWDVTYGRYCGSIEDGRLYSWGCGYFGRLGNGDRNHRYSPDVISVFQPGSVKTVSCGGNHTAFIKIDGSVWTCGYAMHGQLGTGYMGDSEGKESPSDSVVLPTNVIIPAPASAVSCGEKHTVIITDAGEVYSTGGNEYGQLGLGIKKGVAVFTRITGLFPKKGHMISAGDAHTAVLCVSGEVFTWGRGEWDQLGNSSKDLFAPKIVENISQVGVVKISSGTVNTVALTKSGEVWTFGSNKYGQLGRASDERQLMAWQFRTPKPIPAFRATDVALGGYHTLALIQPLDMQLMQHAADGNTEGVRRLATQNTEVVDQSNGYRPLHWAARMGHAEVATVLMSLNASHSAKEQAGNSPLHLAAMNGHTSVMKVLLTAKAGKDALNDVGQTPLHLAVINKKTTAARLLAESKAGLEIRDQAGKRPLDYCTFEEGFPLKVLAGVFDVYIVYDDSAHAFVQNLVKGIERSFIKCLDVGRTFLAKNKLQYTAHISAAKGVVFVVTTKSPSVCAAELALTKDLGKPLFPIWKEKIQLSGELESIIYRQQLVDFSDQRQFQQSLGQLVSGLKNIYLRKAEKKKEEEKSVDSAEAHQRQANRYILVSYDAKDELALQLFKRHFPADCGLTVQTVTSKTSRQGASDLILHCWMLLVVLSSDSIGMTGIRDHIALAENHRKLIFPIIASQHIEAPKYDLSQPDSAICIDNAKLLVSVILQNENVAAMTLELGDLKMKTSDAEKTLAEVNEKLEKIYAVIPKERPAQAAV